MPILNSGAGSRPDYSELGIMEVVKKTKKKAQIRDRGRG